jgi:hypothetical protein
MTATETTILKFEDITASMLKDLYAQIRKYNRRFDPKVDGFKDFRELRDHILLEGQRKDKGDTEIHTLRTKNYIFSKSGRIIDTVFGLRRVEIDDGIFVKHIKKN